MKKMKALFVSVLTVVLALFCLVGCFKTGKYVATSYKMGAVTIDLEDSDSYVELKGENVAVVSIDLGRIGTIDGEGTWTEGEDNAITITVSGINYNATLEGNVMTLNILGTELVLEK